MKTVKTLCLRWLKKRTTKAVDAQWFWLSAAMPFLFIQTLTKTTILTGARMHDSANYWIFDNDHVYNSIVFYCSLVVLVTLAIAIGTFITPQLEGYGQIESTESIRSRIYSTPFFITTALAHLFCFILAIIQLCGQLATGDDIVDEEETTVADWYFNTMANVSDVLVLAIFSVIHVVLYWMIRRKKYLHWKG